MTYVSWWLRLGKHDAEIKLIPQDDKYCVIAKHSYMTGYDRCGGVEPLLLGLNVLSKVRIYFATKERVLYLTPADTVAADLH